MFGIELDRDIEHRYPAVSASSIDPEGIPVPVLT